MTVEALVLATNPSVRDWLTEALGDEAVVLPADSTDPEEFAAEVGNTPGVGLVFVEFDQTNASERANALARVSEHYPGLTLAAVGENDSADAVLAAMRAGARDFLVVGRDAGNLSALVAKAGEVAAPSSVGGGASGQLFAVVSGASGVGVSFLAAHLALGLQMRGDEQRRVLLLDMTVPGGSALIYLNTEQGYNALDALRDVDRCDQTLIDTAFTRYQNGIYVLSLPEDAVGPPHVDDGDFARLLDNFRHHFDYVVTATNTGIGVGAVAALVSRAERSLLMTAQSVRAGRQNKHLLHALRQSDTPVANVGLVIDRFDSHLDLTAERLSELLDIPHQASMGGQHKVHLEAMNAGEPLYEYAARDAYCQDVDALIRTFTGEGAPATKAGGWLSRWFG